MATSTVATPTTLSMDWLLSEPLLDAALAQISSMKQFAALESNFQVAEESGKQIPDTIRAKLADKRKQLWKKLIEQEAQSYLDKSGLGPLVGAKRKWDDGRCYFRLTCCCIVSFH
jgi:hypothetical protein